MRTLTVAVLLLLSPAAFSAENCFVQKGGNSVVFLDNGENGVRVTSDGRPSECAWAVTPDRDEYQTIECADGTSGGFWFASKDANSDSRDMLIFEGNAWYRSACAD